MESICLVLASSHGKDKIIRLCSYASTFIASFRTTPPPLRASLRIFASHLSGARTILRLFDDIPMLKHILDAGQKNEDTLETWLVTVMVGFSQQHIGSDLLPHRTFGE